VGIDVTIEESAFRAMIAYAQVRSDADMQVNGSYLQCALDAGLFDADLLRPQAIVMLIIQLSESFRFEPAYIVRPLHEFERIHVVADHRCIIIQAGQDSWLAKQLPGITGDSKRGKRLASRSYRGLPGGAIAGTVVVIGTATATLMTMGDSGGADQDVGGVEHGPQLWDAGGAAVGVGYPLSAGEGAIAVAAFAEH
jgi:hypothetical protein